MNSYILSLILFWSSAYNIDPTITMKVIKIESNYNTKALGSQGEIGLMQLKPSSFPNYSISNLYKPDINIMLGVKYLSECKKRCQHKNDLDWILCFNAGITGGNKYKYPKLSKYVRQYYDQNR